MAAGHRLEFVVIRFNLIRMVNIMNKCELLMPALRQYRHNDDRGLVTGYDQRETQKIVMALLDRVEQLENGLMGFKKQYSLSPWIHRRVDEAMGV